jgi:hypothetical protein
MLIGEKCEIFGEKRELRNFQVKRKLSESDESWAI